MFPNEHLLQIAKAGMDAILLYVTDVDKTPRGYLDFNELIYRASRYGIDVYAYSYMRVFIHPDDANARARYDSVYGRLFRHCPKLKGVVLVGESIGFPSRDPDAAPCPYYDNNIEGIPSGKPSADMWPCYDYSEWLSMIRDVIFAANPNADVVFWTYNWGNAPRDKRVKLIRSLPKDVSLLVTYEMFHKYKIGNYVGHCADYTLSFVGPGEYFTSEAEAAHECGIRLYAMTNTGGLTWDMGLIPYEPMPYQWIERYKTMRECHDKWGLCGIMESHHYGFWPSFISQLARQAFEDGSADYETILLGVLRRNYGGNAELVDRALKLWSEAITYYTPTNEDQYGAFRIGAQYPFNLGKTLKSPTMPITGGDFALPKYPIDNVGKGSLSAMRIKAEIASLDRMLELLKEGQAILESAVEPNTELEYLINFGRYLITYVMTGVSAKRWYRFVTKMQTSDVESEVLEAIEGAEALIRAEQQNVEAAVECVKFDSRLGWEPRMEYRSTVDMFNWKKRQLDYVLNTEIAAYRRSLTTTIDDENVIADNFTL